MPAADLAKLACAVAKAKERFGMPASSRVLSCCEAGRDGFWLHRHLVSVAIENEVVDAASIEVSRRLRHVKTDRLDGDRLRLQGRQTSGLMANKVTGGLRLCAPHPFLDKSGDSRPGKHSH